MDPHHPMKRPPARLLVSVAVLHVLCCGSLILWLLLGSAGIAALGSTLDDPLIQGAALLVAMGMGLLAWRRFRASAARHAMRMANSPAGVPGAAERSPQRETAFPGRRS